MEIDNICQECDQDVNELVARQFFRISYGVDFVCHDCFETLEGVKFSDYSAEHYYGVSATGDKQ